MVFSGLIEGRNCTAMSGAITIRGPIDAIVYDYDAICFPAARPACGAREKP
jgi:hypothetical protein